jgi:hypothetical protein
VFLDFGAVATISPQFRQGIIELVHGGLTRDTPRIVRAMRQMGFVAMERRRSGVRAGGGVLPRPLHESISLETLNLKGPQARPEKTLEKSLESLADLRRMNISAARAVGELPGAQGGHRPRAHVALVDGPVHRARSDPQPDDGDRPYLERFVLGDQDWSGLCSTPAATW